MQPFLQKRVFNIPLFKVIAVATFYFFFAYLYHLTLWINQLSNNPPISNLINPIKFLDAAGLMYIIMLIFSLGVWWIIFKKFRLVSIKKRMLIHLVTLPIWVVGVQQLYYLLSEVIGFWHLGSYGQIWDIYIPTLFYILQFSLLHAYEYYHSNQHSLQQQAALREAVLKSELSALKAQLNPHFLYNVFNTISASVPSENEQTRELIAKLSDLFRYQLATTQKELVPLKEELEFVEKYLDLEKARFENRLQIFIDVPHEIRQELVSPMILQPLVENSLKHGLSSLIEGGEILIRIKKQAGKIHFLVADTGIGIPDKSIIYEKGLGLTNTKLRLKKRYNSELLISDNQPRGVKIEFSI